MRRVIWIVLAAVLVACSGSDGSGSTEPKPAEHGDSCETHGDCAGEAASLCSNESDTCVECLDDSQCEGAENTCSANGRCADCSRCDADERCYAEDVDVGCASCLSDSDCGDSSRCLTAENVPVASRSFGTCVECKTDDDCTGACSGDGESYQCNANWKCECQ